MNYSEFIAMSKDLEGLLVPILFFIIFFLYKIGGIVLKLHINDQKQDIVIQNLRDNYKS